MSQAFGIAKIVYRGFEHDCEKGSTLKLGGNKQNPVVTNRKVHRSDEFDHSEIECTVPFKRGQKIADLFPRGDGELQVICDTGQSYTFPDAFITNRPSMTADGTGGKLKITFAAGDYEELLNA